MTLPSVIKSLNKFQRCQELRLKCLRLNSTLLFCILEIHLRLVSTWIFLSSLIILFAIQPRSSDLYLGLAENPIGNEVGFVGLSSCSMSIPPNVTFSDWDQFLRPVEETKTADRIPNCFAKQPNDLNKKRKIGILFYLRKLIKPYFSRHNVHMQKHRHS